MSTQNRDWVSHVKGNGDRLFFILGPCAMENELHTLKTAEFLKKLSEKLKFQLIFKSSFDKANRIALGSYRSVGMDEGLRILQKVRTECELPVITDVHETAQVAQVADVVDVIQTPSFLCRQTDLLVAAGKSGKVVHAKKGQFFRPEKVEFMIQKVQSTGNQNVWIGERGYAFGYDDLIVDYKNFKIMKQFGQPVIFDVTHAVQKPGGLSASSGGDRHFVPNLAAAAIVQGIAGIFMEVHEEPEKALSDGPNTIRLAQLEKLIKYLIDLDAWAKERPVPIAS